MSHFATGMDLGRLVARQCRDDFAEALFRAAGRLLDDVKEGKHND